MTDIAKRLSAFARNDEGAVAVVFGVALVALIAASGVALDFARASHARTKMQNALDSAVLAGVRADSDSQLSAANNMFNNNFSGTGSKDVKVTFTPTGTNELKGTASANLGTTLGKVVGINEMKITASATATGVGGGAQTIVCVLILDKTASQAFLVNSGLTLNAPDCEIHSRSIGDPAAIFNSGSTITTKRVCLAGSKIINNGGKIVDKNGNNVLEKQCATADDPYAGQLPVPSTSSCTFSNLNFNGGTVTMKPGVYCGWINFNNNPKVTFEPGTYVIKDGGWNVNGGTWTGTGVTFYYADTSKIQFNSAVAANITAPTSGTYKDLVMYERSGLARSQIPFNDSNDFNLQGIIYLPSRDVTFNGGSKLTNKKMTIIVNTLILNQTKWDLTPATGGAGPSAGVKSVHLSQ